MDMDKSGKMGEVFGERMILLYISLPEMIHKILMETLFVYGVESMDKFTVAEIKSIVNKEIETSLTMLKDMRELDNTDLLWKNVV